MCGIVGGNLFSSEEQVREALALTTHRGRDASKVHHDPSTGVYLGHNRLAIQGLGGDGDQPMSNAAGSKWVVYNGELWTSHIDLRQKLEDQLGPLGQSDTRLLIPMYELHGQEMANMLDGMFAFAILDQEKRKLYLARDFIGQLPLHYIIKGGKIAFASEIKALTKPLGLDHKDIRLFPFGHHMLFDLDTGAKDDPTPYYSLPRGDFWEKSQEEMVEDIRRLVEEGVDNYLMSDVPVCTTLSGGIDSLIITYLLTKKIKGLEAFTVSARRDPGKDVKDDLHYARIAAKWLDIKLHEVFMPAEGIPDLVSEAVYACEDPRWMQIATGIAQIPLGRAIGEAGFKVAFGGEAPDDLFATYNDVFRWHDTDEEYDKRRLHLTKDLGAGNLIRSNKATMFGGTVEVRFPFLHRPFVDYVMRIHPKYRRLDKHVKPLLRQAFAKELPEELVWRPKVTMQEGVHTHDPIKDKHLGDKSWLNRLMDGHFNHDTTTPTTLNMFES